MGQRLGKERGVSSRRAAAVQRERERRLLRWQLGFVLVPGSASSSLSVLCSGVTRGSKNVFVALASTVEASSSYSSNNGVIRESIAG